MRQSVGIFLLCVAPIACDDGSDDALPTGARPLSFDAPVALVDVATVGSPRIVALGEARHLSAGMLELKAATTKALILSAGVRVVALETPWRALDTAGLGLATGGCQSDPDRAVRELLAPQWQAYEVTELLKWICHFNDKHPDDPVSLIGFDVQQPSEDAAAVTALVQALPEAEDLQQAVMSCDAFDERGATSATIEEATNNCLAAVTEVRRALLEHHKLLESRISQRDLSLAELGLAGLESWQARVFDVVTGAACDLRPQPCSWKHADDRDKAMFEVLTTLLATDHPTARVAMWAHNGHLARNTDADAWPGAHLGLGTLLADEYGDDYRAIALVATTIVYRDAIGERIFEADPSSFESAMSALPFAGLTIDSRRAGSDQGWLQPEDIWLMNGFSVRPALQFDGIAWMRSSAAALHID